MTADSLGHYVHWAMMALMAGLVICEFRGKV